MRRLPHSLSVWVPGQVDMPEVQCRHCLETLAGPDATLTANAVLQHLLSCEPAKKEVRVKR